MRLKILLSMVAVAMFLFSFAAQAEREQMTQQENTKTTTAILAGGCFWCVESDFDKLEGVVRTTSGYSGGTIPNPTYQNYHDDIDGYEPHVEVVEIEYNPAVITYQQLLDYYFRHVDPTDGGGQFCDRGAAYRPVIYVQNDQERQIAKAQSEKVEKALGKTVEVDILPASRFWAAEDYHQDYHNKNTIRYNLYRWNCGRDQKVKDLWGKS